MSTKEVANENAYVIEAKGGSDRWGALVAAWNQGIDAHLEAFTKSTHSKDTNNNWVFRFDRSELKTLIRRLSEAKDRASLSLANSIRASETLDEFLKAYIEAALWSSTDNDEHPLDQHFGAHDLAEETMKQFREDCDDFKRANAALLAEAYQYERYDEARAGHDFWLTRNGHGAGFWDRGLDEVGDKLSEAARVYGSCDLYVGDDQKIYC